MSFKFIEKLLSVVTLSATIITFIAASTDIQWLGMLSILAWIVGTWSMVFINLNK